MTSNQLITKILWCTLLCSVCLYIRCMHRRLAHNKNNWLLGYMSEKRVKRLTSLAQTLQAGDSLYSFWLFIKLHENIRTSGIKSLKNIDDTSETILVIIIDYWLCWSKFLHSMMYWVCLQQRYLKFMIWCL